MRIDWTVPDGDVDWLFGTGADRRERLLVHATAALAVVVVAVVARQDDVDWGLLQWLVAGLLTVDVAGGVAANALGTAKRLYHSPAPPEPPLVSRLLRSHVGFAAAHVHPFLVALVFPGAGLAWAATWYAASLGGTAAVVRAPLYLRRPLAGAVVTLSVVGADLVSAPPGLGWLGPLLVVKLVAMHAVREEPYRPISPAGAQG